MSSSSSWVIESPNESSSLDTIDGGAVPKFFDSKTSGLEIVRKLKHY
jgi:hypothetical protein